MGWHWTRCRGGGLLGLAPVAVIAGIVIWVGSHAGQIASALTEVLITAAVCAVVIAVCVVVVVLALLRRARHRDALPPPWQPFQRPANLSERWNNSQRPALPAPGPSLHIHTDSPEAAAVIVEQLRRQP